MRILGALGLMFLLAIAAEPAARAADAPVFALRDTTGQEVKLEQYRGKVVMVQFWATWCGPCKTEMPHLQKMYTDLQSQGLVVLSISSDDARSAAKVKPYITTQGYTFPVLLDKDSAVTKLYNPQATLPYLVVVGRDGQIASQHSGYNPGDEVGLRKEVEELLAASAPGLAPVVPIAPPPPK